MYKFEEKLKKAKEEGIELIPSDVDFLNKKIQHQIKPLEEVKRMYEGEIVKNLVDAGFNHVFTHEERETRLFHVKCIHLIEQSLKDLDEECCGCIDKSIEEARFLDSIFKIK